MKIFINRAPVNGAWGGGNAFVKAFRYYAQEAGHTFVSVGNLMIDPPDVILLAGIDSDELNFSATDAIGFKQAWKGRKDIKLVARINDCDARKGTHNVDQAFAYLSAKLSGTIFVSNWMKRYFDPTWLTHKKAVIQNGVDESIFKQNPAKQERINIVTHHWSNNPMKGFDVYDELDRWIADKGDRYTFTYIGRDRGTFKNTKVIPPCYGEQLGEALGAGFNVYISASRWDPGPNHVLEALSCKIPTYVHADGGGCVEFAGVDHTYDSFQSLTNLLESGKFEENYFRPSTWKVCVEQYLADMEIICKTK